MSTGAHISQYAVENRQHNISLFGSIYYHYPCLPSFTYMHSNILVHFSLVHNGKKRSGLLPHPVDYVDHKEEVIHTYAHTAATAPIWSSKRLALHF